ncbi:ribonucleotide-diphosphate reductase subunit rnr1 [Rhizophlyctis rosea]|nr:ribonucleotide-diphosphate reductase subunit rnr1 [Rhizophlyctis rosea]
MVAIVYNGPVVVSTDGEALGARGSIQNIPNIPDDIKKKYKTAFDLSQRTILEMAADRAPYVDQSQSMNVFLWEPTYDKMMTLHFAAWELGLKTGMYYLRQSPSAHAVSGADRPTDAPTEARQGLQVAEAPEDAPKNNTVDIDDAVVGGDNLLGDTAPACSRDDPECLMCSS